MLFAVRRALRHGGQLLAIISVAVVVGGALAAASALTDRIIDTGVDRTVASADPADQGVVIDGPLGATDESAVTAAIDEAFRGAPIDVARTLWGTASSTAVSDPVLLVADADIAAHAALVDGVWPTAPDQIAVAAPAVESTGLRLGDDLELGDRTVHVVGVWAGASDDPTWGGQPAVFSGRTEDAAGPVLVEATRFPDAADSGRVHWTVSARHPVADAELPAYRAGLGRLNAALDDLNRDGAGLRAVGGWDATLARAADAGNVARGIVVVPVVLLLVVGALVIGLLARAAGRRAGPDVHLLRARGAAAAAVIAESAGIAALPAIGALAAASIVGIALGVAPSGVAALAAGCGLAVLALVTVAHAGGALAPPTGRDDIARGGVVGLAGLALVIAVLTGLAAAQLLTTGLAPGGRADVAAAASPAAALVTVALIAALVAAPLAAGAAQLARRGRGLTVVLALRRVARQSRVLIAGIVSLSLAAAAIAFAAVAVASANTAIHAELGERIGADVRAVYDISPTVDVAHPAVSASDVSAPGEVFAALGTSVTAGQTTTSLVAVPAGELAAATDVDAARLASGTPRPLDGDLEARVTAATAGTVPGAAPGTRLTVTAWLTDVDGAARAIALGSVPVDTHAHALRVHGIAAGLSLAAIDVQAAPGGIDLSVRVELPSGERSGGAPLSIAVGADAQRGRALTVDGMPDAVPAVITRAFADRLALHPGEAVSLRLGTLAQPIPVEVAAIRDQVPGIGAASGVSVPLSALVAQSLEFGGSVPAADQLWAHTADVDATAAALRAVAERPVHIITAGSAGTAAVIDPILALFAAGIALVAALAAAGAVVTGAGAVQARRADAVPLRAFGFGPGRQARATALELAATALFAVVAGGAAGVLIALWLGPALLGALSGGGVL
nr:hypothetical protein [Microbacterium bovistercoris]